MCLFNIYYSYIQTHIHTHIYTHTHTHIYMGSNCHLFQGYTSINKNTEIEILYQNILKLQDKKVISIKPEFHNLLTAEAIKNRYNKKQPILLTHQLKIAAKELCNHPNITIKRADQTDIFVVLNKTDYYSKLQNILDDHTKFKELNKNLTNQLR